MKIFLAMLFGGLLCYGGMWLIAAVSRRRRARAAAKEAQGLPTAAAMKKLEEKKASVEVILAYSEWHILVEQMMKEVQNLEKDVMRKWTFDFNESKTPHIIHCKMVKDIVDELKLAGYEVDCMGTEKQCRVTIRW